MKIPDNTKIQSIDLKIIDMKTSLHFYSELLGFKKIHSDDNEVLLSATGKLPYLLKLVDDKNSKIRNKNSTGMYHVAFKFKNRKELARVFMRLFNNKVKFQGFTDHLVSEAIYLADPDGNGVELYADKPKEQWERKMGQVVMDSLPLDLSILTNELDDPEVWNGIDKETDIGHIHLNVSDLLKAEKFYNHILEFNISNAFYPGAMFFSAGDYHHHIGTNIWFSKNSQPNSENILGLINYTIKIPDKDFLNSIKVRAKENDFFIEELNETDFYIVDFDKNKIKLVM